jgi:peptidoglycan hydrolase-like protein with peptidoglycan-binding domain
VKLPALDLKSLSKSLKGAPRWPLYAGGAALAFLLVETLKSKSANADVAPVVPVPVGASKTALGQTAQAAAAVNHPLATTPMSLSDVQGALNALGFGGIAVDGINGPQTKAAVKKFQTAAHITSDGIVGPQTTAALRVALAALQGPLMTSFDSSSSPPTVAAGWWG